MMKKRKDSITFDVTWWESHRWWGRGRMITLYPSWQNTSSKCLLSAPAVGSTTESTTGKTECLQEIFDTHCCFSFKCRILICFKWWSACVCVCVRERLCECVHACVCACTRMHMCSEHYICVCRCMSVEEAGAGERERMWKWVVVFLRIYFLFIVILNVPSWVLSPSVKGTFSFLCIVYSWLKDWSDLNFDVSHVVDEEEEGQYNF